MEINCINIILNKKLTFQTISWQTFKGFQLFSQQKVDDLSDVVCVEKQQ